LYILLKQESEVTRIEYVTKFIKIALMCESYHNFASMHSIFSALYKLNKLGAFHLNRENSMNFSKLKSIFERDDALEKLIDIYRVISLPATPALWVYMRAMQKFQDFGFYIKLPEYSQKFIKYQSIVETSQIIRDFRRLQSIKYPIAKHEFLHRYLKRDFRDRLKDHLTLDDKIVCERQIADMIDAERLKKKEDRF